MPMRILQPTTALVEKNIVITMRGASIFAGLGGETFDKVPYEGLNSLGIVKGFVNVFRSGNQLGVNEIQTLTPSAPPISGNIQLQFNGYTTAVIPFNANSATIQTALESLASINVGNVLVSGSMATAIVVTFIGKLAGINQPILIVASNTLNSGIVVAVVETVQGLNPVKPAPELKPGLYQLSTALPVTTAGGNILVTLVEVEFPRNAGV